MSFISVLQKNAFENLDITNYTPDIHGWMDNSFGNIITNIVKSRSKNEKITIIEVGSWKGKSCITIANTLKQLGFTNISIIAVDTWLGAPEFWTWGLNDHTKGVSLNIVNGLPTVFYTFTKNIKYYNHDDIVAPFPISSAQAVEVLKHHNIKADIIYVDASHEYEPVKQDITSYWQLLNSGGTMIGDDYQSGWPGVIKAVDELSTLYGKAEITGVVWKFTKS
jgi:predicted O-methyltransferase YrrM